jgi:hypothetical protein
MAAGLGFKTFTTGEVLTAADVNGYLMQGILVFATEAARNSAITSPQEGQFAYTKDNNSLWYYTGSAWVASGATGDIEGVTAGVGISGGGTSGTVTITNSMATAIDAKGDLVPGTGADTFSRLAVGANGTVLTADSAEATGLKWATPASGGGMTSIASGSLSGTSVTLSSISGSYQNLRLIVRKCYFGSNAAVKFKVNTIESNAQWQRVFGGSGGTTSTTGAANTAATAIEGNQNALRNNASNVHTLILDINDYTATTYKIYELKAWYETSDGGNPEQVQTLTGAIKTSSAVTSVEIFSSVTFSGGTYELFGVK